MAQNCPRCGTPNVSHHRYCSNCGAQIVEADAFEAATPRQPGRAESPPAGPLAEGKAPPIVDPLSASTRSDLPPGLGERSGEATYVPYASDVVRELEKPKPNEKWLIPTILVAAGILVVLVAVTIFLALNNSASTPNSGVAGQNGLAATTATYEPLLLPKEVGLPCVLPLNPTPEQEVIYTICRSNEEQIKAWQNLDTEVLKGSRTGRDLQANINKIEELKAARQYADPVLQQLVVTGLKLDLGNSERVATAEVQTSELWSITTYSSIDKSVVSREGPTRYSETYNLAKQGDKWYVNNVLIHNLPTPSP